MKCNECCKTHPCALSPEDLTRISEHLGFSKEELFTKYLAIDYVQENGESFYYLTPCRQEDEPGRLVSPRWTFASSPCVFLNSQGCSIQSVKPKGGRLFSCSLMTSKGNQIGYGKKQAVIDWKHNEFLKRKLRTLLPQ